MKRDRILVFNKATNKIEKLQGMDFDRGLIQADGLWGGMEHYEFIQTWEATPEGMQRRDKFTGESDDNPGGKLGK